MPKDSWLGSRKWVLEEDETLLQAPLKTLTTDYLT